jgi:signal peptide peptidase SppA
MARHLSAFRVLNELHDRPWAITPRALQTLIDVAEREPQDVDLDAVATKLGRPLDNNSWTSTVRDGVAILNVEGPIFRYANLFTTISGATSVEGLAADFQSALDSGSVKQILLNVNSPGGQVDGIQELADLIRAGSSQKPVTAYVDGLAASGGYWLAAAAPTIIAAESSLLGSIGVVASVRDNRSAQERQGVRTYEIVSSKSPYKRPDASTDEGRAVILEMVDALAEIFIGRMAAFRSTTVENVEQKFGQGKTLIASRAVAAGMADEIGSFEPLVARLAAAESTPRAVFVSAKENLMEDTTTPVPAPAAAAPAPAPAIPPAAPPVNERERIAAILTAPEAEGREQLARHLALSTDLTPEGARAILAASPKAAAATPAPPANPLAVEMGRLKNPDVGVRGPDVDDSPAAEASRVLAFVPAARKVRTA